MWNQKNTQGGGVGRLLAMPHKPSKSVNGRLKSAQPLKRKHMNKAVHINNHGWRDIKKTSFAINVMVSVLSSDGELSCGRRNQKLLER